MSIYTENGYKNRRDYLECLAEDYGVEYSIVANLAGLLGADEDFDALIVLLDDYSETLDV